MVKTAYVSGSDLREVQTKLNKLLEANEIAETRIITINSHTPDASARWGATVFWREKTS